MKIKSITLGILTGIILLYLATRDADINGILSVLDNVDPSPIVLGVIILCFNLFLKTYRWYILLNYSVPKTKVFAALSIGYLVNNLLPARLGELARVYLVGRREKAGLINTLGTIIVERVLDTASLLLFFAGLIFTLPSLSKTISSLFFLGITLPQKWQDKFNIFLSSFRQLKNKRKLITLLLLSVLIWLLEVLWIFLVLRSLRLDLPIEAAFFLTVVINFGLFIPSPPGYIGVYHFLATFALLPWGIDKTTALSYALLQHAAEYVILTSIGLWSAIHLSFNPFSKSGWQMVKDNTRTAEKELVINRRNNLE